MSIWMKSYLNILFVFFISILSACSSGVSNLKNYTFIDVSSFSYTPYFTSDITLDNIDFGMGSGGVLTDTRLNEGNFYVYWTDAGTGERHKSINMVTIPENINNSFATLHVYPTNKVEIVFSNNWPTETPKGLEYKKTIKKP